MNAQEQLEELIVRDRSRAAVIFWSVANETLPSPDRTAFLTTLADTARVLDSTRLISAAMLTLPTRELDHLIDDPLGAAVDVIAINQYLGWYYGDRESIPETTWGSIFGKPIVFTEMGGGAKAGNHGDEGEIWTEEYQAALYRAQIEMVKANRTSNGGRGGRALSVDPQGLPSTGARPPGIQDGYNRKGLVSERRRTEARLRGAAELLRRSCRLSLDSPSELVGNAEPRAHERAAGDPSSLVRHDGQHCDVQRWRGIEPKADIAPPNRSTECTVPRDLKVAVTSRVERDAQPTNRGDKRSPSSCHIHRPEWITQERDQNFLSVAKAHCAFAVRPRPGALPTKQYRIRSQRDVLVALNIRVRHRCRYLDTGDKHGDFNGVRIDLVRCWTVPHALSKLGQSKPPCSTSGRQTL